MRPGPPLTFEALLLPHGTTGLRATVRLGTSSSGGMFSYPRGFAHVIFVSRCPLVKEPSPALGQLWSLSNWYTVPFLSHQPIKILLILQRPIQMSSFSLSGQICPNLAPLPLLHRLPILCAPSTLYR